MKKNSSEKILYKLTPSLGGLGGKSGDEIVTLYPIESVDMNNPRMYEIMFTRLPQSAVIKSLYISLIIEDIAPEDVIITAQYSNAKEEALWNGFGGKTDGGFDDDKDDDADIELYNRILSSAQGLSADKSLLIMIENYSSSSGMVFSIEARVFWEIK